MNSLLNTNWPTKRLRFLLSKNRQAITGASHAVFVPMDAIGENGKLDITTVRNIEEISTGYTLFFNGDVVVAKITPCFENHKGALIEGLSDGFGFGTTELYVLTPGIYLDGRYLYYLTISEPFRKLGEANMTGAAGQKRVPEDFVFNYPVPVISIQDQRAIADFLDRETSRIDALISAKEKLLVLLAEKRKAFITRAVTRGLDPKVKLRDSGVPWLGEVPEHWEVIALRFLAGVASGATPDTGKPEYWDGDIPWVSPKDMKQIEIGDSEDHITELALNSSTLLMIPPQSVLIVVRGMILAHSFPCAVTTAGVTINQDMKSLRCGELINPYFLCNYFRGIEKHIISLTNSSAHGTKKIESDILGKLEICVPPLEEQGMINSHINNRLLALDALASKTEGTIALLKERRSALISEAVTGRVNTFESS